MMDIEALRPLTFAGPYVYLITGSERILMDLLDSRVQIPHAEKTVPLLAHNDSSLLFIIFTPA